ncbi:MAG TPA: DUF1761 domain-containing protein [Terriglobales bacterium]|nr:DUF1761 domain-containing protein [Terriglobales bacterium]
MHPTLIAIANLAGTRYRHADGIEGKTMRINWGAVLVAAIVHWLLGAVWFTTFAGIWTAGLRMAPEELQAAKAHPNFWPYLIALLCNLLLAYAIARLLSRFETHTLFGGIHVGLLVGMAVAVAMATELVFELRPRSFIVIAAGYPLVGCIVMGIIIGAWKPKAKVELGREASAS